MSFKHGPKPVIGLVGAIGAGKSAAARCFARRGGLVIDADSLGHEALRQLEIVAAL
ncbi:MAG: dephospho-CoA kinase, partial [Gemmataceae bacterium]|nr:dephospho-CoA kinase [Gemmataceae bacterium]